MMIEKIIYDYLSENLDAPVYMEQPDKKPKRYVVIEKLGGAKHSTINNSLMAVQSYAESMYETASLNERVIDTVEGLINNDDVNRVSLNTSYNFPDTEQKLYRYQAVFDIVHY